MISWCYVFESRFKICGRQKNGAEPFIPVPSAFSVVRCSCHLCYPEPSLRDTRAACTTCFDPVLHAEMSANHSTIHARTNMVVAGTVSAILTSILREI